MVFQGDLKPLDYLPVEPTKNFLAVGWLSSEQDFPTGVIPVEIYNRLKVFCKDPWQPFVAGGVHSCELCQFEGEAHDSANLYIPHGETLYIAPAMIVHYINAHHYQPPGVFLEAIAQCPDMRSMEYKKALIACGANRLILQA